MKNLFYPIYRLKYMHGRKLKLKAPVDVTLELSSRCNMRCSYCYHADGAKATFKKENMSLTTAGRILTSAAQCGVHSLKFNWKGEPTLNPEFAEITAMALRLSNSLTFMDRIVNTNFKFSPMNDDIISGLLNLTKVKISYDSFHEQVFALQRGSIDDHRIITENIDRFYKANKGKVEMVIQAVRTRRNKNEDFQRGLNLRWPGSSLSVRDVVDGRREESIGDLATKERSGNRKPCLQAFCRVIFSSEGIAYPCCPDIKQQIPLGNINVSGAQEIFNSDKYKKLREEIISQDAFEKDPCKTCSSFESYEKYHHNWRS